MSGPWEKYGGAAQAGPWTRYATSASQSPAKPKPSVGRDIARSGLAGIVQGGADLLEAVHPVDALARMFPGGPIGQAVMKPLVNAFGSRAISHAGGADYQPQTTAGRYAKTIGEFAPMAGIGGEGAVANVARKAPGLLSTAASRAAQVVIPAVASQGAGDTAKALGAPPAVQEGARFAGALAGGGLSGARLSPQRVAPSPKVKAPTLDELYAQKNAAYQAVDNAGVRYKPQAFDSLITGIADEAKANNINPVRHPKAASWLEELNSVRDMSPTLTQLDQMRQSIRRDVANASDQAEAYFGRKMIQNIDEFIDAAGPGQVSAGDPQRAAGLIKRARDLNTRVRKIETVQNAVGSADLRAASTYSGGNANNAIRQNLRPLIDPKSKQRIRNLTPDEARALNTAVRGSPAQNAVRLAGKTLDPRGLLGGVIQTTAGVGSHGLSTASIPLGMAATEIGNRMTRGNVTKLIDLIAQGGVKGKQAEAGLIQSEPATFEEGIKALRAALGEARAQELVRARQATLAGSAGLLARGAGGVAPTPDQAPRRPKPRSNRN
jgi:hypothetical protein